MPQRVYKGPLSGGVDIFVPGHGTVRFPNGDAVEVTAEQAKALDATGDFSSPPKPKAAKADTTSEED